MKTVYSSGGQFDIAASIGKPTTSDWQRVRDRVASLDGDTSGVVASQISKSASTGEVTREAYFGKDAFSVGGFGVARKGDSIQGAMMEDLTAFGFRAGTIDTFDIVSIRALLADSKVKMPDDVREDMTAKLQAYDQSLLDGDVRTGTYLDTEGVIHELTEGRVEVPYEDFLKAMPPEDWSPNLPSYRGGEVRVVDSAKTEDGGRQIRQQERMSVDSWPNNLDMTKNSIIDVGPERSRVSWHVFHSDPTKLTMYGRSVLKDDGYIDFQKTDDGKVLIRTHSAHKISTPSTKVARMMLGKQLTGQIAGQTGLSSFFKEVIQNYRAIGEGKPAVHVDR